MTIDKLQMSAELIAKTIGTVGSPLIVISELIKMLLMPLRRKLMFIMILIIAR